MAYKLAIPAEVITSGEIADAICEAVEIALKDDGTYEARVMIVDSLGQEWDHTTDVEVLGFKDRTRVPIRVELSGTTPPAPGGTK